MDLNPFSHEYDLDQLVLVTPMQCNFQMLVTPRFIEHYEQRRYEDFTSDLIINYSKGVGIFVDVGAHYGYFSLLVGKSNPNCKIIAFEPVFENFQILKRNLDQNQINATAINQAVSNKVGTARFYISTASDNSSFIKHPSTPTLRQVDVQVTVLQEVLEQHPGMPALIKIDTDGHELEILEGMSAALSSRDDVRLVVEYNPKCQKLAGYRPEQLLEKLSVLGYDVFFIDDNSRQCYRFLTAEVERRLETGFVNLLCVKKTRSLNVVFLSHSSDLAGAERSLLELVSELIQDYGALCTVYLPGQGPLTEYLKRQGAATVIGNYFWWCARNSLSEIEYTQRFNQSFDWLLAQMADLEKISPDVICTNTLVIPWGAIGAMLTNCPHVWMVNEFGEIDHKLEFYPPFSQVLETIKVLSNRIITRSTAIKDRLFGDLEADRVEVVYRHIAVPEQVKADDKLFTDPEAFHILAPGTIMPSKGQEDAVLAAIELLKNRSRNIELAIVGYSDPLYLERLMRLVKDSSTTEGIHFVPFHEDVFPLLGATDLVLVCSRNEAAGRIILEGMIMHKPVIGTNTGGTPEMIRDGETGLLYEPGNINQLVDKIESLMESDDLCVSLAQNAFKFARDKFTKANFGGRYYQLLVGLKQVGNPAIQEVYQWIIRLSAALLTEHEQKVQTLTAQAAEKEQAIQSLTAQRVAKEQAFSARIVEKEQAAQMLTAQVAEKEQAVQALEADLVIGNHEIQLLHGRLMEYDQRMDTLAMQYQEKEALIDEIYGSRAWKLIQFFRRIRMKLAPPGSQREKLWYSLLRFLGRRAV